MGARKWNRMRVDRPDRNRPFISNRPSSNMHETHTHTHTQPHERTHPETRLCVNVYMPTRMQHFMHGKPSHQCDFIDLALCARACSHACEQFRAARNKLAQRHGEGDWFQWCWWRWWCRWWSRWRLYPSVLKQYWSWSSHTNYCANVHVVVTHSGPDINIHSGIILHWKVWVAPNERTNGIKDVRTNERTKQSEHALAVIRTDLKWSFAFRLSVARAYAGSLASSHFVHGNDNNKLPNMTPLEHTKPKAHRPPLLQCVTTPRNGEKKTIYMLAHFCLAKSANYDFVLYQEFQLPFVAEFPWALERSITFKLFFWILFDRITDCRCIRRIYSHV